MPITNAVAHILKAGNENLVKMFMDTTCALQFYYALNSIRLLKPVVVAT